MMGLTANIFQDPIAIDIFKGIIWAIVGGFVGHYITTYVAKKERARKITRVKNLLAERPKLFRDNYTFTTVENGNPVFEISDIEVKDSRKSLIVAIPERFRSALLDNNSTFEFRDPISFDGTGNYKSLVENTRIHDLEQRITKHADSVANDFLKRQQNSILVFNGKMFGVRQLDRKRSGPYDDSGLKIEVYQTDFFTYQVFASIYRELKSEGHPISQFTKLEDFKRDGIDYSCFFTSFGVSTFILLHDNSSVVLAERSEYITHNERKFHFSMNEAFTQTDLDEGKPNLYKCLYRGLREELNIKETKSFSCNINFLDVILGNEQSLELGITSFISMPETSLSELLKGYKTAADGRLETHNLIELKLEENAIRDFLKKNKMTDSSELALELLLIRAQNDNLYK